MAEEFNLSERMWKPLGFVSEVIYVKNVKEFIKEIQKFIDKIKEELQFMEGNKGYNQQAVECQKFLLERLEKELKRKAGEKLSHSSSITKEGKK